MLLLSLPLLAGAIDEPRPALYSLQVSVEDVDTRFEVSEDKRWLLLRRSTGGWSLLDLLAETGGARFLEGAQAATFGEGSLWLAGEEGIEEWTLDSWKRKEHVEAAAVTHLAWTAGWLVWRSKDQSATALRLDDGLRRSFERVDTVGATPGEAFRAEEERLLFHAGAHLEVWNLESGKLEVRAKPYMTHAAFGGELLRGGVIFAERNNDRHVNVLFANAEEERVLEADTRATHFADLFRSHDGRWVAESDFEQQGVRLYDLTGELPARTVGTRRTRFLGFNAKNHLWTSGEDGKGMFLWDLRKDERALFVSGLEEVEVHAVAPCIGARFVAIVRGEGSRYDLRVYDDVW